MQGPEQHPPEAGLSPCCVGSRSRAEGLGDAACLGMLRALQGRLGPKVSGKDKLPSPGRAQPCPVQGRVVAEPAPGCQPPVPSVHQMDAHAPERAAVTSPASLPLREANVAPSCAMPRSRACLRPHLSPLPAGTAGLPARTPPCRAAGRLGWKDDERGPCATFLPFRLCNSPRRTPRSSPHAGVGVGHPHCPCLGRTGTHVLLQAGGQAPKNSFPSPDFPQCLTHGIPAHLCCMQTNKESSILQIQTSANTSAELEVSSCQACAWGSATREPPRTSGLRTGTSLTHGCTRCCEHRGCSTPCTPRSNQSNVQVCAFPRAHSHAHTCGCTQRCFVIADAHATTPAAPLFPRHLLPPLLPPPFFTV